MYPSAPKVGIRAAKPNELWHVDTTVIRLLDGSKVYLRAVIDNCSRRILSWWLGSTLAPAATAALLAEAANGMAQAAVHGGAPPSVMVDGGVENFNGAVDQLVSQGTLKRILAQTDIGASNSMIEAFLTSPSYYSFVLPRTSKRPRSGFSTLIRRPIRLPRRTWTDSSSPRFTRCKTVWRETPSMDMASFIRT